MRGSFLYLTIEGGMKNYNSIQGGIILEGNYINRKELCKKGIIDRKIIV